MELRLGLFSGAVREWSRSEVATSARNAGFDGVEWEMGPSSSHISSSHLLESAEECQIAAQTAGLEICAVSANPQLSPADPDALSALREACRAVGTDMGRVFAPPFERGSDPTAQFDALHQVLHEHATTYQEHGVTLVIELSAETLIPSPELLVRVCRDLPPRAVGALYDPSNMLTEGNLHPAFAVALLGQHLRHVHMKNEKFIRDTSGWHPMVVPADEGMVDWCAVYSELDSSGYDGWVVIDHLSGPITQDQVVHDASIAKQLWTDRQ